MDETEDIFRQTSKEARAFRRREWLSEHWGEAITLGGMYSAVGAVVSSVCCLVLLSKMPLKWKLALTFVDIAAGCAAVSFVTDDHLYPPTRKP